MTSDEILELNYKKINGSLTMHEPSMSNLRSLIALKLQAHTCTLVLSQGVRTTSEKTSGILKIFRVC